MSRSVLFSAMVAMALVIGACKDDARLRPTTTTSTTTTSTTANYTIAGTLTWASWVGGDYIGAAYPRGTNIGPTGFAAADTFSGTSTSADYFFSIPPDAGEYYVLAFSDTDGSTDPTLGEGGGCSGVVTLGGSITALTGIDINLTTNGWCPVSP